MYWQYKPLRYLFDLVKFVLLNSGPLTASRLMDVMVILAQQTADINIIDRYKRFKRAAVIAHDESLQPSEDVDTQECLQILYLTATLSARNDDDLARFWRNIRFDFVSMLLRNSQHLDDIILMVKMLNLSVRQDTFAMIVAPPASQSKSEEHIIERLFSMLIEVPQAEDGEEDYDAIEIAELREQILCLIETMCDKLHCAEAIVKHRFAIGRLVRLMNDELNAVYLYRYGHDRRIEIINQSVRLLDYFTSTFADVIHLQEKLRAPTTDPPREGPASMYKNPPASIYKYPITLSRLAFSESIFYERGIDEDVLDRAHQMLENFVTPEEADALQKAFVKD